MVAPVLNDYEFQYKDTGVLLNSASVSLPFWDITKVGGLTSFPEIDAQIQDLDGRHGSAIYAQFFKNRSITLEGTLYASASDFDTPVQTLRTSLLPDGIQYPFYFKTPNQTQRYVMAEILGFQCDLDTGRRIGRGDFQISLGCEDPRHYIDSANANWTTAVNFNLTNSGNTAWGPLISVTAGSTTTATITIQNVTSGAQISFSTAVTVGQALTVDLDLHVIKVAGAFRAANVTVTGSWPSVPGTGVAQAFKVTSNIGNGTATQKSAWL